MKYLVIFKIENEVGHIECEFPSYPPTAEDIYGLEHQISMQFKSEKQSIILNWLPLSESIESTKSESETD